MIPSLAIREKAMQLLAADTATLAQAANALHMWLVKSSFVPAEALVLADVTLADFDGSTPLDVGLNTQPEAQNPGTTDSVIDLKAPAGGWRWETTGVTNLPQTIYGYVLTTNDDTTVYASALLESPVELTAVNQRVEGLDASITQLANSML
jgi:hypothetical protein